MLLKHRQGLWKGNLQISVYSNLKEYSKKSIIMEITMRICLAIALISGFLVQPFRTILAISIIHKIAAIVFTILLLVININKIFINKKYLKI